MHATSKLNKTWTFLLSKFLAQLDIVHAQRQVVLDVKHIVDLDPRCNLLDSGWVEELVVKLYVNV